MSIKEYLIETNPNLYKQINQKYPRLNIFYKILVSLDKVLDNTTMGLERFIKSVLTAKEAD